MDEETLHVRPTAAGGESGPIIGRFSARGVSALAGSLLTGLLAFAVARKLGCGFVACACTAAALPLLTTAVLLALWGKPAGHARHWLTWMWFRVRGTALLDQRSFGRDRHGR